MQMPPAILYHSTNNNNCEVSMFQMLNVLAMDENCCSASRSSQPDYEMFVFSVPAGDAYSARMAKEERAEG